MKALVLFISAILSAAHGRILIYNQGTLNPGLKITLHFDVVKYGGRQKVS